MCVGIVVKLCHFIIQIEIGKINKKKTYSIILVLFDNILEIYKVEFFSIWFPFKFNCDNCFNWFTTFKKFFKLSNGSKQSDKFNILIVGTIFKVSAINKDDVSVIVVLLKFKSPDILKLKCYRIVK